LYECEFAVAFIDKDCGDLAKFYPLSEGWVEDGQTLFICDDDLIYPKDFSEKGLADAAKYGIVSYGGKGLKKQVHKNFRGSWSYRRGVFEGNSNPIRIDIPLTCVTVLEVEQLNNTPKDLDIRFRNKGDILMAKWSKLACINITCPEYEKDWFKYNPKMGEKETIWDDMISNPKKEKEIAALLNEMQN
jgi:hypothetical protein